MFLKYNIEAPSITEPPRDIEIQSGSTNQAMFTCKATGKPTPQIEWSKMKLAY